MTDLTPAETAKRPKTAVEVLVEFLHENNGHASTEEISYLMCDRGFDKSIAKYAIEDAGLEMDPEHNLDWRLPYKNDEEYLNQKLNHIAKIYRSVYAKVFGTRQNDVQTVHPSEWVWASSKSIRYQQRWSLLTEAEMYQLFQKFGYRQSDAVESFFKLNPSFNVLKQSWNNGTKEYFENTTVKKDEVARELAAAPFIADNSHRSGADAAIRCSGAMLLAGKLAEEFGTDSFYKFDTRILTMSEWELAKHIRERLWAFKNSEFGSREALQKQIEEMEAEIKNSEVKLNYLKNKMKALVLTN